MSVDIYAVVTKMIRRGDHVVIPENLEPDLIAASEAGNSDSLIALLRGYTPLVRKTLKITAPFLEDEDAVSATLEGFSEALAASDGTSLAKTLPVALREAYKRASGEARHFAVPARSLSRYFGILNRADRDLKQALAICTEHHMERELFMAITEALAESEMIEGPDGEVVFEVTTPEPLDESDQELLEVAWAAVDSDQELVLQSLFGFLSYDIPRDVDETSYYIGMPRREVLRNKRTGLATMREALGLFDIEDPDTEKELAR